MTIGPGKPYYAAPYPDPYPTPEPVPYEPESPDNPEQGPLDSTPATTDVLFTPDEAIANQQAHVEQVMAAMPEPEPVEPPMVTAYKATLPPEPT